VRSVVDRDREWECPECVDNRMEWEHRVTVDRNLERELTVDTWEGLVDTFLEVAVVDRDLAVDMGDDCMTPVEVRELKAYCWRKK